MEALIRRIIATLNDVDVKGRDNLNRLLGCIQALEKLADALHHNQSVMKEAAPCPTSQRPGDTESI